MKDFNFADLSELYYQQLTVFFFSKSENKQNILMDNQIL